MAPKPSVKGKRTSTKSTSKTSSTSSAVSRQKPISSPRNRVSRRPPAKQQKTRPGTHNPSSSASSKHKKQRTYTDAELNLPILNAITPASAATAPRGSGKKKNKIYVDDRESMMTIMALVNAEKEGQIESKMVRMRRLEEIREAKRIEAEKREEERRSRFEGMKKGLKGKGRRGLDDLDGEITDMKVKRKDGEKRGVKRVSFA